MRLSQINQIISGLRTITEDYEIDAIAAKPNLATPRELALVFPNKFSKAHKLLKESQAKVFLISYELSQDADFIRYQENLQHVQFLIVKRPKFALKLLLPFFERPRLKPTQGVHLTAVIETSAQIHNTAAIAALSYIGPETIIEANVQIHSRVTIGRNVYIGENTVIKSGVVIEDYSVIGSNVIIHPNAVIGSDGYSYVTEEPSNLEKLQKGDFNFAMDRQIQHKVNSAGHVIIENDVEIGANTCIDRGTIGPTLIKEGSKIDNLVQIAHNVEIGKDTLIISLTGIAGSARIGDRVTMAGSSGCGDGVTIANDVVVGAFSAVNSDLDPFLPVLGAPAIPYGEFMKRQRAIARLPRQQEELRKLKSKVEDLCKEKI